VERRKLRQFALVQTRSNRPQYLFDKSRRLLAMDHARSPTKFSKGTQACYRE
jgi:hypothetical protein